MAFGIWTDWAVQVNVWEHLADCRLPSMAEVALAGPDEGHAGRVGNGDDFVVADRAAGCDRRRNAASGRDRHAVEEGEVGIGGEDATPRPFARPVDRELHARH